MRYSTVAIVIIVINCIVNSIMFKAESRTRQCIGVHHHILLLLLLLLYSALNIANIVLCHRLCLYATTQVIIFHAKRQGNVYFICIFLKRIITVSILYFRRNYEFHAS